MNLTRRRFLLGSFVLGCATALGLKPTAPRLEYFDGETAYLKTTPFDFPETSRYFVAFDTERNPYGGDYDKVVYVPGEYKSQLCVPRYTKDERPRAFSDSQKNS